MNGLREDAETHDPARRRRSVRNVLIALFVAAAAAARTGGSFDAAPPAFGVPRPAIRVAAGHGWVADLEGAKAPMSPERAVDLANVGEASLRSVTLSARPRSISPSPRGKA